MAAIRQHADANNLRDEQLTALFKQFDDIQETPLNQRLLGAQQALQSTTLEPDSAESAPLTPQRLAEAAQKPSSSNLSEASPTPAAPPVQQDSFDSPSSPAP